MPTRSAARGRPLDSATSKSGGSEREAAGEESQSLHPEAARRLRLREATETDRAAWDAFVGQAPAGDPLQAWGWAEAVAAGGRERPVRLLVERPSGAIRGVAQVLVRSA